MGEISGDKEGELKMQFFCQPKKLCRLKQIILTEIETD